LTPHPHLAQIAFSVTDLKGTHAFYRDALGFLPAGGTESFRGPVASLVQGLPDAASICWWMVDQRDFMQLEMFEFESPPVRPLPGDWRPCDIGYASIGLHVRDFDAVLARLDAAGARPLAPALGGAGARRVCVRDPEGVLLELMEDDSRPAGAPRRLRPEVGVVARSVTVSVPDLARARRTEARGPALHGPEHEALWGLAGARRETLLLDGGDFFVELVQYVEPRGRPRPEGYRISDQGILNVALGFRDKAEFFEVYRRVLDAGYSSNCDAIDLGDGGVVYLNDDQGFSVEMLCASPAMDEAIGFTPRETGTLSTFDPEETGRGD
jgi:catechol 2,3-dioxygenase-like lactoylglutathione lyase family enzyme